MTQGRQLDSQGRPLHPLFREMISDPNIGVVNGKGAYWHWGPNFTADPVIIKGDNVLLIKGSDTGQWALPGGFIDQGETALHAALREAMEETGLDISQCTVPELVYEGLVADIRTTANSWAETSVFLLRLPSEGELPVPAAGDDAADAAWFPIELAKQAYIFGSHRMMLELATETFLTSDEVY